MKDTFHDATAFSQQLCWDVTGKNVENMFTGTTGASTIVCAPSSQPTTQPTSQPTMEPTKERTTIVTRSRDILQSFVGTIKNTIKPRGPRVRAEL